MTDHPVVSPLLDASGNPSLVVAGELIESAWGNSVSGRTVNRYPDLAALTAASASQGTLAVTVDHNVVWIRESSVWRPTSAANMVTFRGVGIVGGQAMGTGTTGVAGWNMTYDPWGVTTTGSMFTVPTGWGGRWQFEWAVSWAADAGGGHRLSYCQLTGGRLAEQNQNAFAVTVHMAGTGSALMAVGDTATINMFHDSTSPTITCNSFGNQYFHGRYVGPY